MSGYDLPPDTPGFAAAQEDYAERSKVTSNLTGAILDVPYGPHERQRLDIFPAGHGAAGLVFLRGGYWKMGSKEERRFPALAWLPRRVTWIVPNYRLAPDCSLPGIVEDAENALNWVLRHADQYGIDTGRIHMVGNSAGAHLAAMVAAGPIGQSIASITLISGLFDLVPLLDEEANDWLAMDRSLAQRMSPIRRLPSSDLSITVCVGGDESEEFKEQSITFADACRENGNPVVHFESPGQHHMSIIGECGTPGTPVFQSLERVIGEAHSSNHLNSG